MSTIPFSSRHYRNSELTADGLSQILAYFNVWREKLKLVETSHLNPLENELRILQRFLVRHAIPLRHEKGIRLVRRVVQCVKRIFFHPDVNVVRMTSNLVDLCRDEDGNDMTLPSRQTSQHYLAALNQALTLYDVSYSHATNTYAYLSKLLTVGHLIPAYLTFAASIARVAVLIRGLRRAVGSWYEDLRPWIHALKGENADLTSIYGVNVLPDAVSQIGNDSISVALPNIEASTENSNDIIDHNTAEKVAEETRVKIVEQFAVKDEDIGEVITKSSLIEQKGDSICTSSTGKKKNKAKVRDGKKKVKKQSKKDDTFEATEVKKVSTSNSDETNKIFGKKTGISENESDDRVKKHKGHFESVCKAKHGNESPVRKMKVKMSTSDVIAKTVLSAPADKITGIVKADKKKRNRTQNSSVPSSVSASDNLMHSTLRDAVVDDKIPQTKNTTVDEIDDIFSDFL